MKRKVKVMAWAVYRKPIKYNNAIINHMCDGPMAIYCTKKEARGNQWMRSAYKKFLSIIPCIITYNQPKRKRRAGK